jgi:ubiquinone/menaquinone biosynthesis C-methylase UbiE
LIKTFLKIKDKKRAVTKLRLFENFIPKKASIVDIGAGSGQFSLLLQKASYAVSSVDIKDKTNTQNINLIHYDGSTLPFPPACFDVSMLITVLHHCPNPERVFKEAVRVSKNRIFILEDVYSNMVMKYLTWAMDSLVNLEFFSHPHTNKSEKEWEILFSKNDVQVLHKQKLKVLFIFAQVLYILEKK